MYSYKIIVKNIIVAKEQDSLMAIALDVLGFQPSIIEKCNYMCVYLYD